MIILVKGTKVCDYKILTVWEMQDLLSSSKENPDIFIDAERKSLDEWRKDPQIFTKLDKSSW